MKSKNIILIVIGVAIVVIGAASLMKKPMDAPVVDSSSSKDSLDWVGTYTGVTPCADCEGIQTIVNLSEDQNFSYQMHYLGKEEELVSVYDGSFDWDLSGSIINLTVIDSDEELPSIMVAENKLILLDQDNQVITGELAEHYILEKMELVVDQEMYETNKAAFPTNLSNYDRYVIDLEPQSNENDLEVEILVGKTELLDCNQHFIGGEFKTEVVEGYGYEYQIFESDGLIGGTQMLCFDEILEEKFVYQPLKVRYNSQLPVVVFAPEGFEVQYRFWVAGNEVVTAQQQ